MGARHSKRSVDISGKDSKESAIDDPQSLDGKLEKIEEGAKVAVNGASHAESKEEHVPNGDPTKDMSPDAAITSPSSPTDESVSSPVSPEGDDPESSQSQPPKKKEKVKKKWSFRSISFSKKEKPKSPKDEVPKDDAEQVAEVAEEKIEEKALGIMGSLSQSVGTAVEEAVTQVEASVKTAGDAVEEQTATTKDQVEKITAKVAEKAEALVVKMEAMTIEAADAVVDAVGLGKKNVAEVEASLSEVEVAVSKTEETVSKTEETVSKTEEATSKMEETVLKMKEDVSEEVAVQVTSPDAVVESVLAVDQLVTKSMEEIPPPLPASPPPSEVIADMVMQVVEKAVSVAEANELVSTVESLVSSPAPDSIHEIEAEVDKPLCEMPAVPLSCVPSDALPVEDSSSTICVTSELDFQVEQKLSEENKSHGKVAGPEESGDN